MRIRLIGPGLLWHGWLPMLSGVNDASESAGYLVEVTLGRYSSDLLLLV